MLLLSLKAHCFFMNIWKHCFDVLCNLHLLPKFNEGDPETFFSLFERVAESRKRPGSACTLMLHSASNGRAQEAYSLLSFTDGHNYLLMNTYELVSTFS